jgi:23S rRNA (pseudouridine1915-N3)-methyltransferase
MRKAILNQSITQINYLDMKVLFLMVGKTSEKWLSQGINEYSQRIKHYLPYEERVISDVKNGGKLNLEILKQMEGQAILKTLDTKDQVVLLDENGKQYTSRGFSGFIEKQMIGVGRRLVFVFGGAWGFSDEVYSRANAKISLSQMTFSHQMGRLIFVEQLYRAMTILKNESYHHD